MVSLDKYNLTKTPLAAVAKLFIMIAMKASKLKPKSVSAAIVAPEMITIEESQINQWCFVLEN